MGKAGESPAWCLVDESVVMSAQAAEVVGGGLAEWPTGEVVEVAALSGAAAAGEPAASVAVLDVAARFRRGRVGVGGGWWSVWLAGAQSTGVGEGE
jgi:hypothetical protein